MISVTGSSVLVDKSFLYDFSDPGLGFVAAANTLGTGFFRRALSMDFFDSQGQYKVLVIDDNPVTEP